MADKIRLIFTTAKPLAWQFRPKREHPTCPPPQCISCMTGENPGCCFVKNVVYKISCSLCHKVYIGQTERTARSRIIEHTKQASSHVFTHMSTHGPSSSTRFSWKILATHPYTTTRLAIEALFIQRENSIINGCEGMKTLDFIKDIY
jgi:hypothetical protein